MADTNLLSVRLEVLGRKATQGPYEVGYRALDITALDGRMKVFDVRGWGFLTGKGSGALGLSHDEGKAIQEANAELAVLLRNHLPEIIASLRSAGR